MGTCTVDIIPQGNDPYIVSTEDAEEIFNTDGWPEDLIRLQDSEKHMYEDMADVYPYAHVVRLSDMKIVGAGDSGSTFGNAAAIIELIDKIDK